MCTMKACEGVAAAARLFLPRPLRSGVSRLDPRHTTDNRKGGEMTSTLATPSSIAGAPEEELVALRFLVRYREPTRSSYAMGIRQWFQFCYDHGIQPMKAQRADLEMWLRKLDEVDGLKNSTM